MIHTKLKISIIVFTLSIIAFVFSSYHAGYCGIGPLVPYLPYSVKPIWFNGQFWLVDYDKWGVVTPDSDVSLNNDKEITISKIVGYAFGSDIIYVWFLDMNEQLYYVIIDDEKKLDRSKWTIKRENNIQISDLENRAKLLKLTFIDMGERYWTQALVYSSLMLILSGFLLICMFLKHKKRYTGKYL